MLSIRDLSRKAVQDHIDATNEHLPKDRHIAISLVNSARNFVVTGPPISLYGLNLRLRKDKAPTGLDQTRIPFTERKVRFVNRFLPITAPFHSPYLVDATKQLEQDLKGINISTADLGIPTYDTHTGQDIRETESENIVPRLIRMITADSVEWEKATVFPTPLTFSTLVPVASLVLASLRTATRTVLVSVLFLREPLMAKTPRLATSPKSSTATLSTPSSTL
ncbi:hypothetical protein P3342_012705 [Pyrenophora teres f. teres]|nr:hypothetical protein P3342_012705 [Pyrenophora teres f. teres]